VFFDVTEETLHRLAPVVISGDAQINRRPRLGCERTRLCATGGPFRNLANPHGEWSSERRLPGRRCSGG
jgi:hypothetical protein